MTMLKKIIVTMFTLSLAMSLAVPAWGVSTDSGDISFVTPEGMVHPYNDVNYGDADPQWSSGLNSTHQFITEKAISLVRSAVSSYPLASYTSALKTRSDWPDSSLNSQGEDDAGLFIGHFYDPDTGRSWDGATSPTAKSRLVSRYQRAVSSYKAGNRDEAMTSLAFALHYAADLSTPHHAANKTALNSNHTSYESWVKNNQNSYVATSLSSSTLTWARNTSISDMGHNFAVNAKAQINNALSSSTYATATSNALPKAQRNCAAVLYKFLVDVGAV